MDTMTHDRLLEMMTAMLGREPTDLEMDQAVQGYNDSVEQLNDLQGTLPADKFGLALEAELGEIVHELTHGPRRPV